MGGSREKITKCFVAGFEDCVLAEVGDVIKQEDGAKGRSLLSTRQGSQTIDNCCQHIIWLKSGS